MTRPAPASSETSRRLAKVKQKSTAAEIALRREMYRIGLRYRVNYQVSARPRRVADIAFPGRKVAVFVDGCFWHGCPQHATWPKHNADFWRQKIEANRLRDLDTNQRLCSNGWVVLRFWSHTSPADAASAIAKVIADIDATSRPSGAEAAIKKSAGIPTEIPSSNGCR